MIIGGIHSLARITFLRLQKYSSSGNKLRRSEIAKLWFQDYKNIIISEFVDIIFIANVINDSISLLLLGEVGSPPLPHWTTGLVNFTPERDYIDQLYLVATVSLGRPA